MLTSHVSNALVDEPTDEPTADKIITTEHISGLKLIHEKGVAAVIVERRMSARFQNWIDQLSPEKLPSIRKVIQIEQVRECLAEELSAFDLGTGGEVEYLLEDASALAETIAKVLNVSHIRVRFDVVDDDACRRFHIDRISARLICTYRGQGTQYGLQNDHSEPDVIHQTHTGELIFLRGSKWEDDSPSGLLHRSPPIEGTGETRLVLVIDPISDPQTEA